MAEMRAQVSLIFEDEELFNNLIVPEKKNRSLRPLIVKLLEAYYYSDDVRNLVDNFGLGDSGSTGNGELDEYFRDAFASLSFWGSLINNASATLSEGKEHFKTISEKFSSDDNSSSGDKCEFGSKMLSSKNLIENARNVESGSRSTQTMEATQDSAKLSEMENRIKELSDVVMKLVSSGERTESYSSSEHNGIREDSKSQTYTQHSEVSFGGQNNANFSDNISEVTRAHVSEQVTHINNPAGMAYATGLESQSQNNGNFGQPVMSNPQVMNNYQYQDSQYVGGVTQETQYGGSQVVQPVYHEQPMFTHQQVATTQQVVPAQQQSSPVQQYAGNSDTHNTVSDMGAVQKPQDVSSTAVQPSSQDAHIPSNYGNTGMEHAPVQHEAQPVQNRVEAGKESLRGLMSSLNFGQ